ncbi:uncharacterized protein CMC5_007280 [Chondromyces crocatus]|uniref:Secreted protein n=1 Tax=Chondromyces crocatus TaxID=52 RepID=A0A0K1E7S4_CHOCO|nr:uncharacterized protein CMC5_007280 [Chondromyces crocatus]
MPRSLVMRLSTLALVILLATGCDTSVKENVEPSATSSSSPASTPSVAEPPPPPPADLNISDLQAALRCAPGAKSGPCRVLAKMASCATWNASVPSGDGRWLGRASVVEADKTSEVFVGLRLRSVPLSDVGPGQLPIRLALVELPKSEEAAYGNAERAIRAYERGDIPPRASPTLDYLKRREEWPDAPVVRTQGGQILAIHQGGAYFCEGPKRTVLAVQLPDTGRSSGTGTYAELWATTW